MISIRSMFLYAIILLGTLHSSQSTICNITIPVTTRDGTIREVVKVGCCPGYSAKTSKKTGQTFCKPRCDRQCVNSKCTAPNSCSCNEGFVVESEYSKNVCVPRCDNCTNGFCAQPNVCQCRAKFHKNEDGICEPICNPGCIEGICTAPNVCKCKEGYQKHPLSKYLCVPACEKPCVNGFCSGVNECTCWQGFTREINDPHKCFKRECRNGVQGENGQCQCAEDHEIKEYVTNVTVISECVLKEIPKCGEQCVLGLCPVDEKCECLEGFRKELADNGAFQCIPVCELGCENGRCIAPNTCECQEGFSSVDRNQTICTPRCENSCRNGFCSAPNICSCHDGFAMEMYTGECRPVCENCGVNQECISPGECQCKMNFKETKRGNCEEIQCHGGFIIGETCNCPDGLQLDDGGTCREPVPTTTEILNNESDENEYDDRNTDFDLETDKPEISEDVLYPITIFPSVKSPREVIESDMELIPTTLAPLCINGNIIDGKCVCAEGEIVLMENECVPRTTIEYHQVPEKMPKLSCSEKCISGDCHFNGTCKCPQHFKVSPDDRTECIPLTECEMCFSSGESPCGPHCFPTTYTPVKSIIPQYLIILMACLITVAIAIIALVLYKRMQKHDYYTGPVQRSGPVYAYEMEGLT